jgi:hypothetical protein
MMNWIPAYQGNDNEWKQGLKTFAERKGEGKENAGFLAGP